MLVFSLPSALRRASAQYRNVTPLHRWYAWFKYRMDPCYLAIAGQIPPNTLTVDLGTGLGMLPVLLAHAGDGHRSLGVEHDAAKVRTARKAVHGLPDIHISEADALSFDIPPCDVVTIVDVLHYYPGQVQRELLTRCAQALRPGGRLLIREGDGKNKGLSGWTRWVEKLSVRLGWNKGTQACFRPTDEIAADLTALGFCVRQVVVSGRFLPGNVLLIAEVSPQEKAHEGSPVYA